MRKIATLSLVLAAGVAVALMAGSLLTGSKGSIEGRAQWRNIYKTQAGLVAGADLIVLAEHTTAEPGRFVGDDENALPFTNNRFDVRQVLRGDFVNDELLVEQTGGIMAAGQRFNIDDGGPYTPGATYMLFLKAKGDGSYYVINYQARYEVIGDVLEGVDPTDGVVARLHGSSLERGRDIVLKRSRLIE
jgi:hypothetical protein